MGIELHACYRVAGFHYPPPLDHDNETEEFYRTNTAWRGVDRAGNPTPRMAYTYPGVREFVVGLLAEMAGYGVDGVCLLYNRRPPLVEYEPPLVDGFHRGVRPGPAPSSRRTTRGGSSIEPPR